MTYELTTQEIPEDEDPFLLLSLERNGIPATARLTLTFEGDWANIFDDDHDTETDARGVASMEIFGAVLNHFK